MNSGSLRYRIAIEQLDSSQSNAAGQIMRIWTPVCVVWAGIKYETGKETIAGNKEVSIANARIRIRWRRGINAGMRVNHDGVIYDINDVMLDMTHRLYMDLLCTQGADDGGGA
jgi:SPP1 family predicted phage head-tail adaptor